VGETVAAAPGPQWVCEVDGKAYPEWQPVTDGGFDTLAWKTAPTTESMSANAAGILPLIVGEAPAPKGADTSTEADIVVPARDPNPA